MMIKRMGKHPVYWVLLTLFPAAVFVVPRLNEAAEKERISVGYVMEEPGGQWEKDEAAGRGAESAKRYYGQYWLELLEYELSENADTATEGGGRSETDAVQGGRPASADNEKLFQYIKYTDQSGLKKDIETGEIACGIVFDKAFTKKLKDQDYYHCITLYLPEGMNVGGIVQEDVFQKIYQVYSAEWYAEMLEQQGYQIQPEEVLQKFSEYQKEGKVFAVNYEVQGANGGGLHSYLKAGRKASLLSLRGILTFLTLLSSLLGALDGSRDRKRGRGKGIAGFDILAMTAVGAPILPATLFLAGGMVINNIKMTDVSGMGGQMEGMASMGSMASGGFVQAGVLPEVGSALLYGLVLWLFAMVLSKLLPEKLLEGAMPCFLLIVLLCCPVFFDLGEAIPLVGYLSKLFPITWYLGVWG